MSYVKKIAYWSLFNISAIMVGAMVGVAIAGGWAFLIYIICVGIPK